MGAVALGTAGVEGAALGVEIGAAVAEAGPGGVAAATVMDAGGPVVGPVVGPVGGEVGATLEGVALDVETGGVVFGVLGTGTERIAMPTGTVADELTEAGEPTAAGELT
jgi:hypothetical protein